MGRTQAWKVDDQVAGYVTKFEGFSFATVRDSGHEVRFPRFVSQAPPAPPARLKWLRTGHPTKLVRANLQMNRFSLRR